MANYAAEILPLGDQYEEAGNMDAVLIEKDEDTGTIDIPRSGRPSGVWGVVA